MLLTSLPATFVQAEVRLPSIIGSYMVVQQGMKVPIWGWATPGEKVTVAMRDKTAATVTEEDGKWQVKIGPFEPGGTNSWPTMAPIAHRTDRPTQRT